MSHTVHENKEALLIWAHRTHHSVPHGFNVNIPYYGAAARALTREFQRAHGGLTVDGVMGPRTEAALWAAIHPPQPPTTDPRHRFAAEMWWAIETCVNHGDAAVPYDQVRPFSRGYESWQRHDVPQPPVLDCTAIGGVAAKRAGRADPFGQGFNGLGNTETLMGHLPWAASVGVLMVGDIIVFSGPIEDQHAVYVLAAGVDPVVASHGVPGVHAVRFSSEQAFHSGQPVVPLHFNP